MGILNGVDYAIWSPDKDALIPMKYSARNMAGKRVCKQALLEEFLSAARQSEPAGAGYRVAFRGPEGF